MSFLILTLAGVFLFKANAERWCPFGGVEALYTYMTEGNLVCSLAVSNFYILAAVLVITLWLRRAFCGYACPIGTISEGLQRGASRLGLKPVRVPPALDQGLSLLKYAMLVIILYFTWRSDELIFRSFDPCYALLSRHGEDITFWAYIVAGSVITASLFITLPFCRWFCPLAAVLNLFSRFGIARIQRNPDVCTRCAKCVKSCPMAIPVDSVQSVTHARCTSCFDCMGNCPEEKKGALTWNWLGIRAPSTQARKRWARTTVISFFLLVMTIAVSAAYLSPLPSFIWTRGDPSEKPAVISLKMENLGCRGNATQLTYFLDRDDELEIPGYIRVEAWPGPGLGQASIFFDPDLTNETRLKMAITEAYYDATAGFWRSSPFKIDGYDPLGL
ncbi:MAG: 4Fe-4S binding protein [Planctomycetota bacterium]